MESSEPAKGIFDHLWRILCPEFLLFLEVLMNCRRDFGVIDLVKIDHKVASSVEHVQSNLTHFLRHHEDGVLENELDVNVVQSGPMVTILHVPVLRILWPNRDCQWQAERV